MKISKGIKEDGIIVGNNYDKYNTKNPIAKKLMEGFSNSLSSLVEHVNPDTIHEVGCGEGVWVVKWNKQGIKARGSDFSEQVIRLAKSNAEANGLDSDIFAQNSVYEVTKEKDTADLIVCCEVLEHLESPEVALKALKDLGCKHYIFSVPREPIWCGLNMIRGKYLMELGNTPGHIQHWSKNQFIELIGKYFQVDIVESPLPWTMVLCRND